MLVPFRQMWCLSEPNIDGFFLSSLILQFGILKVVPAHYIFDLAKVASDKGVPTEVHVFAEGGHGFGGCLEEQMPQFYHDRTLVEQWLDLYVTWLFKITSPNKTYTK